MVFNNTTNHQSSNDQYKSNMGYHTAFDNVKTQKFNTFVSILFALIETIGFNSRISG